MITPTSLTMGSLVFCATGWSNREDNPKTPSRWIAEPEEYAVGFNGQERSTNGGLALNYGFTKEGYLDTGLCEASLWTTGENLRDNKKLKDTLEKGGTLVLDGLQGIPIRPVKQYEKDNNSPPWASYMLDNDPDNTDLADENDEPLPYSDRLTTGWIGDVAVLRTGCGGDVADVAGGLGAAGGGWPLGPLYASDIPYDDPSDPEDPDYIPPPPPPPSGGQCAALKGEFICDRQTGTWIYDGALDGDPSLDADKVKVVSTSPGLSIPAGTVLNYSAPGTPFSVTGLTSGEIISANLCIFDEAASKSGAPFQCCKTTVAAQAPNEICEKAGE